MDWESENVGMEVCKLGIWVWKCVDLEFRGMNMTLGVWIGSLGMCI